jgi:hypothetical protein
MNINQYLEELNTNTTTTLELVGSYSTEALVFKNEGECSIADILEHICISDNRTIFLLKSTADNVAEVSELYGEEKLKKIVVDYKGGPKITENEIKELQGAITDFSSFEHLFLQQRNLLYDALKSGEITISNNTYKHLYLGNMTVTDWLRYLIFHTNRHMNDVKDSSMAYKKI